MQIENKEVLPVIRDAVKRIVDIVAPTFGPNGSKVLIDRFTHRSCLDDGVQILRDLSFDDPMENAVLNVVRETAVKTNDRAGDGTTGSIIMLGAILESAPADNVRETVSGLKKGLESAKQQLRKMARPVTTRDELEKVARISYDDEKVAKLIAEGWERLGPDGVLTVDKSGTMETTLDVTEGVRIGRGYVSPYMVTDPARMEAALERVPVLLTDYRLTEASDIVPLLNLMAGKGMTTLAVICDGIEQSALATAILNRHRGVFNLLAVTVPPAEDKAAWLEDIGILTGARVFSSAKGDKLQEAKIEDLGRAERFVAKSDESVIVGPKGKKEEVEKALGDLRAASENAKDERTRKSLSARLAMYQGKVGVIRVGAMTENEEKAVRYKVEDAVNAVRSAYRGGVVAGGGFALVSISTGITVFDRSLTAPLAQIMKNAGIKEWGFSNDEAMNVVTGNQGPFMDVGVCDPVDVLVAALDSAVSIACQLLTTTAILVEVKEEE